MTRKDRKRYSREFKIEAVRQSFESGKPAAEVARDLDISVHHLYRWRDLVDKSKGDVFPGHGNGAKKSISELDQLRRENARLREERDILKKAAAFFAKESIDGIDSLKSTDRNSG